MKNLSKVLGGLAVGLMVSQANAVPVEISDIVGSWQNHVGGVNVNVTNVNNQGTDEIRWGNPYEQPDQSGYNFTPSSAITDIQDGVAFVLGEFEHVNQPIHSGGAITQVEYALGFQSNGEPQNLSALFTFNHDETTNAPPAPECCPDIVTVSQSDADTLIEVGGNNYFFNLLGFADSVNGPFNDAFLSDETNTNPADLYAMITSRPTEVPEPGMLALLGLGLAALSLASRRKMLFTR